MWQPGDILLVPPVENDKLPLASNLIVSKGYEDETDDVFKQAIERGQIVVGVEILGEGSEDRLACAQRILDEAGARQLLPL